MFVWVFVMLFVIMYVIVFVMVFGTKIFRDGFYVGILSCAKISEGGFL